MDNKFNVSLETAKLLKEKGYDGDAEYAYHEIGDFSHWGRNVNDIDYLYAAPTKSEVIDWLEDKGLIVENRYYSNRENNGGRWAAYINRKDNWGYVALGKYYLTRLAAEEAAIIKALELL